MLIHQHSSPIMVQKDAKYSMFFANVDFSGINKKTSTAKHLMLYGKMIIGLHVMNDASTYICKSITVRITGIWSTLHIHNLGYV